MATLIRTVLFFLLGASVAGFLLAAVSAFVIGDVDPDFAHQPFAAFTNLVMRNLLAAAVESAIFALGLMVARLVFARKPGDWYLLAGALGFLLVFVNYLISLIVRKMLMRTYDLAALVYLLAVPLLMAFVYPAIARRFKSAQQPSQPF